jgi:hypothetical protein
MGLVARLRLHQPASSRTRETGEGRTWSGRNKRIFFLVKPTVDQRGAVRERTGTAQEIAHDGERAWEEREVRRDPSRRRITCAGGIPVFTAPSRPVSS